MSGLILFGDKKNFAIEIESTKRPKILKLCFWANGIRIGLFTKAGMLNISVQAYKKFLGNKENYYSPVFDSLRADEIPYYLLGRDVITYDKNISTAEFSIREKLYLHIAYFGEQFYNSNRDAFFLYKEPNVVLIICKKGILDATAQKIKFEDFKEVFEEYISYCEGNNLI